MLGLACDKGEPEPKADAKTDVKAGDAKAGDTKLADAKAGNTKGDAKTDVKAGDTKAGGTKTDPAKPAGACSEGAALEIGRASCRERVSSPV